MRAAEWLNTTQRGLTQGTKRPTIELREGKKRGRGDTENPSTFKKKMTTPAEASQNNIDPLAGGIKAQSATISPSKERNQNAQRKNWS